MAEANTLETLSPKELGKHLREVRRRKGLSLSEVARGAGLTRRELNAYEKGKSAIPDSDLFVLAGSCGVDVAELRVPTTAAELGAAHEVGNALVPAQRSSAGCLHDRRRRRPTATQPGSRAAAAGPGRIERRRRPRALGPQQPSPWPKRPPAPLARPGRLRTKPSTGPTTRRFRLRRRPRPAAPPSRSTCSRSSPASPTRSRSPSGTEAGHDFFGRLRRPRAPPVRRVPDEAVGSARSPNGPRSKPTTTTTTRSRRVRRRTRAGRDATGRESPDLTSAADAPPINVEMRGESVISPWDALRGSEALSTVDESESATKRTTTGATRRRAEAASETRRRHRYLGARDRRRPARTRSGSTKCRRRQPPTPTRARSKCTWTTSGSPTRRMSVDTVDEPSRRATFLASDPVEARRRRDRKPRSHTSSIHASPAHREPRPVRGPTSPTPTPPAPASTSTGATPRTTTPTRSAPRHRSGTCPRPSPSAAATTPSRGVRAEIEARRSCQPDRRRGRETIEPSARSVELEPTPDASRSSAVRTTSQVDDAVRTSRRPTASRDRSVRPDRRRARRRVRALPTRALRTRAHRSLHPPELESRARPIEVFVPYQHEPYEPEPTEAFTHPSHEPTEPETSVRAVRTEPRARPNRSSRPPAEPFEIEPPRATSSSKATTSRP